MTDTSAAQHPAAFDPSMRSGARVPQTAPSWDLATERRIDDGETLSRYLGWASLGIAAVEIMIPGALTEYLGMEDKREVVQLYGAREAAVGIGILNQRKPEKWIWARVAGDVLDMATLATGLSDENPRRDRVAGAFAVIAGVTALDILCARQLHSSIRHRVVHEAPRGPLSRPGVR